MRLPPPEHSSLLQVCSVVLGRLLHFRRSIPILRRLLRRIHLPAGDYEVGWIDLRRREKPRKDQHGDGASRTFRGDVLYRVEDVSICFGF